MTKLIEEVHKLSADEKLDLMGLIWEDLASKPDQVTSPDWHGRELRLREERIKSGEATFSDWEGARERIAKKTS